MDIAFDMDLFTNGKVLGPLDKFHSTIKAIHPDAGILEWDPDKAKGLDDAILVGLKITRNAGDQALGLLQEAKGQITKTRVREAEKKQPKVLEAASDEEPPRPLRRELPPSQPFPVNALGPILEAAAHAIQETIQAPMAIIGNSLLAGAALAVQQFRDVEIDSRAYPASDFFLTIGESGERKSAVDRCVLEEHRKIEEQRMRSYKLDIQNYKIDEKFHAKQVNDAVSKGERDFDFSALPAKPRLPLMLVSEPSWEGLLRLLEEGGPSIGLFSDEAGRFLAGYAMSEENRIKTAAGLSELWSGGVVTKVRKGDGSARIAGRRLAIHLMTQPKVSNLLLSNEALADQGMLSRFLCCYPESTAGKRKYRPPDPFMYSSLRNYYDRIRIILETPMSLDEEDESALKLPRISLAPPAKDLWIQFHDNVEEHLGPDGEFCQVRAAANKMPEHALRLASILTIFDNPLADAIDLEHIQRGIALAIFYLHEAKRLFEAAQVDSEIELAQKVLAWILERDSDDLSLNELYRFGPNSIRTTALARRMMKILEEHGWASPLEGGVIFDGAKRKEAWKIRKI